MLKTDLIHPELLRGLAEAGHGARILLADGNYPVTVKSAASARKVFLNFIPGMIDGLTIVRALAGILPVESCLYMAPPDGREPEIVAEYHKVIGESVPFEGTDRFGFYDVASAPDTSLVIASGEQRTYANLLLTVGVRQ